MKTGSFSYDVFIQVYLIQPEIDLLMRCASRHYDGTIKSAAQKGGFLYGWRNRVSMGIQPVRASSSQLDLCCKTLEMPSRIGETPDETLDRLSLKSKLEIVLKSVIQKTMEINYVNSDTTKPGNRVC